MVNIYNAEDGQKDTLLIVFDDHKIPRKPTMIRKFTTDGNLEGISFTGISSRGQSGRFMTTTVTPYLDPIMLSFGTESRIQEQNWV